MTVKIDNIVSDIINEKCILFLGPELLINSEGKYYKAFFKEIAVAEPDAYRYYPKDNLFSISGNNVNLAKVSLRNMVSDYYASAGDEILLSLISQIPFSLIINVAPDTSINRVFQKNQFPFNPSFIKDTKSSNYPDPSAKLPEIYNIFGSTENKQSIVLNHTDLFKSIKDLQQTDTIPKRIRDQMDNAYSFIFLGIKFDTWYYQLLLNILKIDESVSLRVSDPQEMDEDAVSVISSHFQIVFADNNPLKLVEKIYDQFKVKRADLIRTPKPEIPAPRKSVYISYAWKDTSDEHREKFVDRVNEELVNKHQVQVYRDRNVLTIQDSIESFMNRIGKGKAVLMVISDKYLRSDYCMYEAWQVYKNDNYLDRVFLVVLPDIKRKTDANGKQEIDTDDYVDYWSKRKLDKEKELDTRFSKANMGATKLMQKVKVIHYIYLFIDEFLATVADTIHFTVPPGPIDSAESEKKFQQFIDDKVVPNLNEK